MITNNTRILTIFCVFLGSFLLGQEEDQNPSSASKRSLMDQDPSLKLENVTIEEGLNQIAKAGGFELAYSNDFLSGEKRGSFVFKNISAKEAVQKLSAGTGIKFIASNKNNRLIVSKNSPQKQNTGNISGTVVDKATGAPMVGANVSVVGTNYGDVTNEDGIFSIDIPVGTYSVHTSYIGYTKGVVDNITVEADQTTQVDFVLTVASLAGEQVVVIGYGIQNKRAVTGSISSVRVDDMQKVSTTELSNAIQGRIPGVNVSQVSGAPGAGAEIKVRGAGTLGNASPLVIVDGVPSSMSSVDPSDIESLDILKDASAAAIYGSRAGNGVMLITTKRGKAGATKISFSSKVSSHSVQRKFPLVTDSNEYIKIVKQAADNGGVDYPKFVSLYESNPSQFSSGTDWQDAYFQTAPMQDYDLKISGGSENMNFAVSGNYAKQDGIIVTTGDERLGLRVNSDFTKGKLKIGESLSINRFIGKQRFDVRYNFFSLGGLSPLVPVHDNNNPTGYAGQDPNIGFYREIDNIVANMNLRDNQYDNMHILASGYAEYKPVNGMTYTARLSQNIYNNYYFQFHPEFQLSNLDLNDQSTMSENRSRQYHTIMDHTVNYQAIKGKHDIDVLVGYSQEETDYRSTYGSAAGFADNDLRVLGAGAGNDNASGFASTWHYQSYFGRLNYAFDKKYMLQFNLRRDGSSRFSKENRWGDFPSVSLGWRLSEEPFFNFAAISDFKIRASYGELGMQEFGDYMYYFSIASDDNEDLNYPFGPGKEQDIYIGSRAVNYPSIGLKWEGSKQTNFGFDLSMYDDKMSMNLDYYIKENNDVLYAAPVPMSAGASSAPTINAATILNKGVEFNFNYREFEKPLKYEVNLSASTYNNEVTKLGRMGTEVIWGGNVYWALDDVTRSVVGKPLAPFYLYETDGIFKSQSEVDSYISGGGAYFDGTVPGAGDVKYVDQNGDGVINSDDKKYFGTAQPSAEIGLNLTMSYKQFDMNMFLFGVLGKQMFNGSKWLTSWTGHAPGNYHKDLANAWTEDNSNSNIPRVIQDDDRNTQASDLWLEKADYLKLSHFELGYTFDKKFTENAGVNSLRLFLAGDNVFTLTGYTGFDPAIDYDPLFGRGVDRSPYPTPRQFIAGIQIGL